MSEVEIIKGLKEIFKLVINRETNLDAITPSAKIITELGVNSVGLIYLAISIEEYFGVDMTNISFNTFETVQDVIDYIKKNCKKK